MIKIAVVVMIILSGGIIGGGLFFGDILLANRILFYAVASIYYLTLGGIIGLLSYPYWQRSVLVTWSVFAIFFLNFQTSLQEGITSIVNNLLMLAVPVIFSLLGGYVVRFFKREKSS